MSVRLIVSVFLISALALIASRTAGAEPLMATVSVDTEAPAAAPSPILWGGFIEHFHRQIYGGIFEPGSPLSDAHGFRKDVVAALKELKIALVRWPGGCFASGYHWRDGVGRERKPVEDKVWGVEDPNTFGTDEFVQWCRLVGCEPYICGNAGNGTPEEMRDWVEYCNGTSGPNAELRKAAGHPEPWNVKYWSIGNENWGAHEIGAKTPEEWGPWVSKAAELMRAAAPSVRLLAAATPNPDWTLPLLRAAGSQIDMVAIHEYWLPCWQNNLTPDYTDCILHADGPERTLNGVCGLLEKAGFRERVKIAFDEWNLRGWHHPGFPGKEVADRSDPAVAELIRNRDKSDIASQYTMADALFSASFLNACLRHAPDVAMENIAPIVNTRGPLYVHPKGIVKRTTFHVLSMYASGLEDRVGQATVESGTLRQGKEGLPAVDAVATVDASGKHWALALINRHPGEAVSCTVRMKGASLDGAHDAIVLAGDAPDAFNDVEHPDRVVPAKTTVTFDKGSLNLPPHSLTVVKVNAGDN